MAEYNIDKSIEGQRKYCKENNYPHFAPADGICWKCNRNIYEPPYITVEKASNELITSCPYCNISYCE